MNQTNALSRAVGATVLTLLAMALASLVLPASILAAPLPEGSDPVLTLSPQPAVVPTTTVGNQSPTLEFVLHNESAEEAAVDKIALEGEDAGEFSFGGSTCGNLPPGGQCSLGIALKPGSVGAKKTTLEVLFSGGRPAQGFEVSGISAPAHLSFQPGSYDFGLVPARSEAARTTFQIENDGAATTQINSLSFIGNSNGFWFGNSDCYGRWLDPGQTCSLEVDFGPSDAGPYATQVQANSAGENFTANLSGAGAQPIVTASPNPADFGAATVGSSSAIQTIVVSNSGNGPANFFIGIVAGGDSGSFKLLDENCSAAPLLPAGSCTAHLRFAPQSPGLKLARLAFFGDTEGGAMVALQGEGVAPAATLVPSSFDFGSQANGTKSAGHLFTVRNDGGTPLDLGGVSVVGADLDQFALAGDECTGATLAPGAECLVRLRFAPDSAGGKAAKLRVGGEAGAFVAALAGTGTGASVDEDPAAGTADSHALETGNQPPPPRPSRKGRHRRFVRGDAVPAARAQRPRRVNSRSDIAPR
ncbi:MAG TPA: choice-of-anchor D domain-containing protein [Solirubrobacterales bacterium]|jgi:hypothetical protein|nr:choice-of-anchor D domain-containing protein [Solirubrobacterales bacterium]